MDDREAPVHALMVDPLTSAMFSLSEIRALFDEIFDAQRPDPPARSSPPQRASGRRASSGVLGCEQQVVLSDLVGLHIDLGAGNSTDLLDVDEVESTSRGGGRLGSRRRLEVIDDDSRLSTPTRRYRQRRRRLEGQVDGRGLEVTADGGTSPAERT